MPIFFIFTMDRIYQSINQSKNFFHTLIIKYNIFKNNYVGKGKVEV